MAAPSYDCSEELIKGFVDRIAKVRGQIGDACSEAGRDPSEVTLIGVSKVFPVEYAEAAVLAGLCDLGENRVQELTPKIDRLAELGLDVNWHLIGTLQKNKVKYITGKTHLIHSVNTVELAEEISKRSVNAGLITDILIQTNVSGEESKHGFAPDELKPAISCLSSMEGIRLRGLMTMAPIQTYEGEARAVFSKTYELYDSLRGEVADRGVWNVLSMGMSQDYRDAILEGSTCVRIGTAIFGDRSKVALQVQ